MTDILQQGDLRDLPDNELAAAALSNPEAFEYLVERYQPLIFSIARARLQNIEAAEDLAQEVVLRLHLNLGTLRSTVAFPRWIRQVTRNLASNWAASGQVRSRLLPLISLEEVPAALHDTGQPDARASAQSKQEHSMLEHSIRRLPPSLQEVVLLHYAEGLSKSDVARQLGIHPSSVGRHLDQALVRLREDLRPLLTEAARPLASKARAAAPLGAFAVAVAGMSTPARAAVRSAILQEGAGASAAGKGAAAGWLGSIGALLTKGKIAALLAAAAVAAVGISHYVKSVERTLPMREFRGMWIPSVGNMDWPSKRGLTASQQQQELSDLLKTAQELRFNAVMFQVRPCADALYASSLEPWSEFLTGQQGQSPGWDPLEHVVREGHARTLDVHAWINPFRAHHPSETGGKAASHLSRLRPDLVKRYGDLLWLDPGEPEVQQHCLNVVADILTRYGVDGIHYDDYFYPYPARGPSGRILPFPDDGSWQKYVAAGGRLARDDWRRDNINQFIRKTNELIRKTRPHVLFGVSPLGGWRSDFPPGSRVQDAYAVAYADSLKWWKNGWVDYLSPQLYWPLDHPTNGFAKMLAWWSEENEQRRHLWPGLLLTQQPAQETLAQIGAVRSRTGVSGTLFFSARPIHENANGIRDALKTGAYMDQALVPASPWMDRAPPPMPQVRVVPDAAGGVAGQSVTWSAADGSRVKQWCVYRRQVGRWSHSILPAEQTTVPLQLIGGPATEAIAVTAISFAGQESGWAEVATK